MSSSVRTMLLLIVATALLAAPAVADVAAEVTAAIEDSYAFARANLKDKADTLSSQGSVDFWSSGGLIQNVPADTLLVEYEAYSLHPKNITVVELPGGEAAVALYYAEGSFLRKDGGGVPNYLTRVSAVLVKESGSWKIRSAHYSPIRGGTGTDQTALD